MVKEKSRKKSLVNNSGFSSAATYGSKNAIFYSRNMQGGVNTVAMSGGGGGCGGNSMKGYMNLTNESNISVQSTL